MRLSKLKETCAADNAVRTRYRKQVLHLESRSPGGIERSGSAAAEVRRPGRFPREELEATQAPAEGAEHILGGPGGRRVSARSQRRRETLSRWPLSPEVRIFCQAGLPSLRTPVGSKITLRRSRATEAIPFASKDIPPVIAGCRALNVPFRSRGSPAREHGTHHSSIPTTKGAPRGVPVGEGQCPEWSSGFDRSHREVFPSTRSVGGQPAYWCGFSRRIVHGLRRTAEPMRSANETPGGTHRDTSGRPTKAHIRASWLARRR